MNRFPGSVMLSENEGTHHGDSICSRPHLSVPETRSFRETNNAEHGRFATELHAINQLFRCITGVVGACVSHDVRCQCFSSSQSIPAASISNEMQTLRSSPLTTTINIGRCAWSIMNSLMSCPGNGPPKRAFASTAAVASSESSDRV